MEPEKRLGAEEWGTGKLDSRLGWNDWGSGPALRPRLSSKWFPGGPWRRQRVPGSPASMPMPLQESGQRAWIGNGLLGWRGSLNGLLACPHST